MVVHRLIIGLSCHTHGEKGVTVPTLDRISRVFRRVHGMERILKRQQIAQAAIDVRHEIYDERSVMFEKALAIHGTGLGYVDY